MKKCFIYKNIHAKTLLNIVAIFSMCIQCYLMGVLNLFLFIWGILLFCLFSFPLNLSHGWLFFFFFGKFMYLQIWIFQIVVKYEGNGEGKFFLLFYESLPAQ